MIVDLWWKKIANKNSFGLFIKLPEKIAKYFPEKGEDSSPPHITVLYIGELNKAEQKIVRTVVKSILSDKCSIDVHLYGLGFFENDEGKYIAHSMIQAEGLETLRNVLWKALESADINIKDKFKTFQPHATLAYLDEREYSGKVPEGDFVCKEIELWSNGGKNKEVFKIGK